MNRRALLRRLGGAAVVGVAGCLGQQSRDELAVEGAAPTLSPGSETVIVATAYNADRIAFSRPDSELIETTGSDVSPSPDMQVDSFPPEWIWDDPQSSVEATLGVTVKAGANTGAYGYGVSAANGGKRIEAEFEITVDDATG